jgi:cytochrome c peroxidase
LVLVTACVAAACDDNDDGVDGGQGGKSTGGKTGTSGTSGSAGKGGSSGSDTGGSHNGGQGGTSGGTTGGQDMGGGDTGGTNAGDGAGGQAGAGGGAGGEGGTPPSPYDVVRARFAGMSPLPPLPADPTNAFADNAKAATFGQRLFFDEKFSGALKVDSDLGTTGTAKLVSCKSCHSGPALDDERSNPATVSIGVGIHTRNSPPLVNSSFYEWTNWGGRFAAQWELPLAVVENGVIMSGNRLALAHRIFDVYKADYEDIFGAMAPEIGTDAARFPAAGKPKAAIEPDGAWEGMTADDKAIINRILVNYSKSIAAYVRKLVSREAPFDLFMAGDDNALSASALSGARVFADHGCGECHSGAHFSDSKFHALGVPQTGANVPAMDDGRFKDLPGLVGAANIFNVNGAFSDKTDTGKLAGLDTTDVTLKGVFRTPSLRGVANSAPYMHSGQLATLSDVIAFYEAGGSASTPTGVLQPFTLTPQEEADLIAFLTSLTGKAVPAELLADTAAD